MDRFTPTREWFIPKGATKIADKQSDAVAYLCLNRMGKPRAVVFFGKQAKPVSDYYYQNEQRREASVKQTFENRRAHLARTAKAQAERKAFQHSYKVGDIFGTCWGYDQTNREFFECIEVRGKHLVLREIGQDSYSTGWCQDEVTPLPGKYIGEPIRRLATEYGVKIDDVRYATLRKPAMVAGVPVYGTEETTSYA